MTIKEQINKDLKEAMLARDAETTMTLRGVKSAILYAEVASNLRDMGLPEDKIVSLLQKEAKKRQESSELFEKGGNLDKSKAEQREKHIIERYLPKMLTEQQIIQIIDQTFAEISEKDRNMGVVIGAVKQKANGLADGAVVAKLVKERLS
jgi:uncharacterized protein YqeY